MTTTINGITIHQTDSGSVVLNTAGPQELTPCALAALRAVVELLDDSHRAHAHARARSLPIHELMAHAPELIEIIRNAVAGAEAVADPLQEAADSAVAGLTPTERSVLRERFPDLKVP